MAVKLTDAELDRARIDREILEDQKPATKGDIKALLGVLTVYEKHLLAIRERLGIPSEDRLLT